MKATAKSRSKGRTAFFIFAAILFITCGALTAGGLFRLYKTAEAYELSSPDNAAERVLSLFREKNCDELIKLSGITLSELEAADHLAAAIERGAPSGSYSFSRTKNGCYRLSRGEYELAELYLTCKKSGGSYGFDLWEPESLVLAAAPKSYTVTVSPAALPTANGILLEERLIDKAASDKLAKELFKSFGSLSDELSPTPPAVYRLEGLYCPPEISIADGANRKCVINTLENSITVSLYPDSETIAEVSSIAAAAAESYAKFITNDAALDDVLPYFLSGSQFYRNLCEFYNGWYNAHDSYSFEEPRFAGWQIYDDSHISCMIMFNYRITMGRHEYEYPSKYSMSLVRTDSGWKISDLKVI